MTNIREIVIGPSADRPAIVLRPATGVAHFESGDAEDGDGSMGRMLAALQGLPDLLLSGHASTTKFMEVVIHGDLVRASDGVGFRAFAIGDHGIAEQARLLDPSRLTALINVTAVWRLASILVGQKHLADISATLKKIEHGVSEISRFQRAELASSIEAAYSYLRQAESAVSRGERESAVRHQLESIELDMDGAQRQLCKLFATRVKTEIRQQGLGGYANLKQDIVGKLMDLEKIIEQHRLAGLTRLGAAHILAAFPGVEGLVEARLLAIENSFGLGATMCEAVEPAIVRDSSRWNGKAEAAMVNVQEFALGQSKAHRWLDRFVPKPLRQTPGRSLVVRGADGSAMPQLEAIKAGAVLGARRLTETQSALTESILNACSTLKGHPKAMSPSQTRYQVEWGPLGAVRIQQALA